MLMAQIRADKVRATQGVDMTEKFVAGNINNVEVTLADVPEPSQEVREKIRADLSRYWYETWEEWKSRALGLTYGQSLQVLVDRDQPTVEVNRLDLPEPSDICEEARSAMMRILSETWDEHARSLYANAASHGTAIQHIDDEGRPHVLSMRDMLAVTVCA